MQELYLPVYRPGADLSILGMKGLIPGFNLASSYNKAIKIFNDLPFSRNGLYQEMDLLVYLNNSEKGKKFRDFLLANLKGEIDYNLLNTKNNITILEIIKSLKDKSNEENKSFLLEEYENYLSSKIYEIAKDIHKYYTTKISDDSLSEKEKEILKQYYSSAIKMTQVLLGVEVVKVSVNLGFDLGTMVKNTKQQVNLIVN